MQGGKRFHCSLIGAGGVNSGVPLVRPSSLYLQKNIQSQQLLMWH